VVRPRPADRLVKMIARRMQAHRRVFLVSRLRSTFPFEILHCAFMFLSLFARVERSKVAAFAALEILLARVETVLARFQFSDHR
jgi:hypothetical protein